MCGIVGIVSYKGFEKQELSEAVRLLHHRGPDDSGKFINASNTVGLGHTRLSFLDLGKSGHQPMTDAGGHLHVVFNGEIYNFPALRKELEDSGFIFRTNSDTEILLHGYKAWGNRLPQKLKGMFAFALYDEQSGKVLLVRDRFGIKPLYYGIFGNRLVFASELKAILPFSVTEKRINRLAVSLFLANRYIPAPQTIWEHVFKLPPAHFLEWEVSSSEYTIHRYWKLNPNTRKFSDSVDLQSEIEERLQQSVSSHLISDVPVGAFLSGGMDSTTLVSLMKKEVNTPRAFSIGFTNWENSEHRFARMAADALGVDLQVELLEKIDWGDVEKLMYFYDEPLADISILPTFKVSALASGHVKAVLSGEGADECFGGYGWQQPSKFYFPDQWSRLRADIFGKRFSDIKTHYIQAMSMGLFDVRELRNAFTEEWQNAIPPDPFAHFDQYREDDISTLKQIQYLDIHTFMSELVLNKVDRASMANSLETRVPFLDHELVEFLFSLPEKNYFRADKQKWRLRNYLEGKVPSAIYDRPKQGFVGPDQFYMKYDLYHQHLVNGRLVTDGVINQSYISGLYQNKDHWRLWKLFVLENWWKKWM
jgi:asparagine synthase (glutamine-hydrolysing)